MTKIINIREEFIMKRLFFTRKSIFASIVFLIFMLFAVGALKKFITGENWLRAGIEMLIIGTVAFIISYEIGLLLEHLVVG